MNHKKTHLLSSFAVVLTSCKHSRRGQNTKVRFWGLTLHYHRTLLLVRLQLWCSPSALVLPVHSSPSLCFCVFTWASACANPLVPLSSAFLKLASAWFPPFPPPKKHGFLLPSHCLSCLCPFSLTPSVCHLKLSYMILRQTQPAALHLCSHLCSGGTYWSHLPSQSQ